MDIRERIARYEISERRRHVLTGAVSLLLVFALISVGVKAAFGAFRGGYKIEASFAAAGQGLISGSDVKIRGVNVGQVKRIELVDGAALVTMRINSGERIPVTAEAVIRPKTLFGEKFVDITPGRAEATGPWLESGDRIEKTLGGFELERVLSDAYPLLQAIEPDELFTVLSELSGAARGMGESINRSIVNGEKLSAISVRHDADTRQFLGDLADLTGEFADRADDLVGAARDLDVALPTLTSRVDEVETLLAQTARLAGDLADVLDANRSFLRKNVTLGGRTIELLANDREQIIPLVQGLRKYAQTLAQVIRFDVGDGTLMAAVEGLVGGDACGLVPCATQTSASATGTPGVGVVAAPDVRPAQPTSGAQGIVDLVGGLLRGGS
jgi:phospholipid/cholesterol/gamma-HCH transport system substrate-binding protein